MHSKVKYRAFTVKYDRRVFALFTDVKLKTVTQSDEINEKDLFSFKALWDTGATSSCITKKVVDSMGLIASGKKPSYGVHGSKIANTYIIDIGLPNMVMMRGIEVIEVDSIRNNIDVLIGMNVILSGDFSISNANNKTTFSFCHPSRPKSIDYVEQTNIENKDKPTLTIPGKKKKKHR